MENVTESDVLDKALRIIDEALDGKVVNPDALETAIRMLQFCWSSILAERARDRQITESLRHKWDDSIEREDKKD